MPNLWLEVLVQIFELFVVVGFVISVFNYKNTAQQVLVISVSKFWIDFIVTTVMGILFLLVPTIILFRVGTGGISADFGLAKFAMYGIALIGAGWFISSKNKAKG